MKYIVIAGAVPALHDRGFKPGMPKEWHPENRELTEDAPFPKMGDIFPESYFGRGEVSDLVADEFIKECKAEETNKTKTVKEPAVKQAKKPAETNTVAEPAERPATQEDLDADAELVAAGVKVGDMIKPKA